MESFPTTVQEFKKCFPDETSSLRFFFNKRWPQGFTCSYCNWTNDKQLPARTINCHHCGHPTSVTTNTVMHGTRKSLSEWLLSIWWLTAADSIHSAKELQRFLKISSYQTAWVWMQKLRMAMALADSRQCRGTVEIGSVPISPGGKVRKKVHILAAAELMIPSGITGRIKMITAPAINEKEISGFLRSQVRSDSSIILPDTPIFRGFETAPFVAIYSDSSDRVKQVIESCELWLNRTHRGGVAIKHLQHYLDEFCFRSNAAMLPDSEAVFNLLLRGVISSKSLSYRSITKKNSEE